MKPIRAGLLAAAVVLLLGACGGTDAAAPASSGTASVPPTPVTSAAPQLTGAEAEVADVFHGYYRALLARDFVTACRLNAPESRTAMLANIKARGIKASTCEEAFTKVYADQSAATLLDRVANTAQVTSVTVNGDTADITWTSQVQGNRPTVTNTMRRIDGAWQLLDTKSK